MFDRWHSYQLSKQLAGERTARSIGKTVPRRNYSRHDGLGREVYGTDGYGIQISL
jgi:hypothetical protein